MAGQEADAATVGEQIETSIAQFAAAPRRRLTMFFDPAWAGQAARAVRAGGSLASFVEAMHEEPEGTVDPAGALASDAYEYTAWATPQEAEAEMAAWHDLLHGSGDRRHRPS